MQIHILSPEIASQIAAGEVVERPASVVKELLENSLDAKSSFITIHIEGAGLKLIEVSDDGIGIPGDQISLAVERHATSKLESAADLFHISTLGFRGEALASIGSVSRLSITSRSTDSQMGARIRVETGKPRKIEFVGASVGTLVRVADLFINVPARLKFLKNETTEKRQIDNLVMRYALAYPEVRFHLYQDGRSIIQTSGNGDFREILAQLYGADVARQMLQIEYIDQDLQVTGFTSPPGLTRSNRKEMIFFVNGRPVQDTSLAAALLKGYHTYLMVGRYPMSILFIHLPPEKVDVNVHPTKAEVRFQDPDRLFSVVQAAVRRAILAHSPVPGVNVASTWDWQTRSLKTDFFTPPFPSRIVPGDQIPPELMENAVDLSGASQTASETAIDSQPQLGNFRSHILRLIGQIANTYLVAEGPDGLYLIDQHAAHERILFERFMNARKNEIPSQSLLKPETVELTPAGASIINEQIPVLLRLGFQVEPFGQTTFLIRSVPGFLAQSSPVASIRALVEDFEEDESPFQKEIEARIIARVCKRAAIKAGQPLSSEEQQTLIHDLEACQSPRTCPHGRPTMIHLSVDLLERQFGRKGAR